MNFRTDLALERCEFLGEKNIRGIDIERFNGNKATVTRIDVRTPEGAKAVDKPMGRYVTVEVTAFAKHAQFVDDSFQTLCGELKRMLPKDRSACCIRTISHVCRLLRPC